ncbi:polyadenylate-binding protein-interacting protein 11-like [Dorcoceras hygrometricum]|uniref:Polyadenylate-binding protein-interacting protein 11-like n=1 Tax=Dorcoceras hygrometricum TaxID=472368 RepID=A0A2Z7BC80_9LAMI|nr:polyadenylate-binding protein-interacting protein 11-like [Dorcoceras hygrometricum]
MAVVDSAGVNVIPTSNRADRHSDVAADHHRRYQQLQHISGNEVSRGHGETEMNGEDDEGKGFKEEMRDLEEMLSKLNPMAEEFVPPSLAAVGGGGNHMLVFPPAYAEATTAAAAGHFGNTAGSFLMPRLANYGVATRNSFRKNKSGYAQGKRRMNSRTSMAQREDVIRRTVYVSDIDHQVTEEQLASLFINCGQVVDCRICGDPNSVLRFAFVEFTDEEGAQNALSLAGTMLGFYPVRIMPSKTAIAPVNPTFLPRSEDEREMCARTIYCTNIDKKVTEADVKLFFESICGEVLYLRLLGDYRHSTRIAFVEFVRMLDENKNLIMAILETQKMGKMAECAQFQAILQKNLMYLAAIADAQPQGSAATPTQLPTSSVTPPGSRMLQSHVTPVQQQQVGVPVAKLPFQLNSLRSQDQQNQLLQFQQQQLQGHFGLGGGMANNGMHLLMQPGVGGSGNLMDLRGSQAGGLESNSGDGHGHSTLGSGEGRE